MSRGPLPLAFLLAMAADGAHGAAPELNTATPLQRGSLSALMPRIPDQAAAAPADRRLHEGQVGTQLVQFFPNFPNFRNCFVGNWRNC